MSKGVNKVILVGNVGKDPEIRNTSNGKMVANISIATSEAWVDKSTGEKKEQTEWHNIVFFGPGAEIVSKYVRKGGQIYIEGKLKTEKYEKDGVTRYSTKIIANTMQMLGGQAKPASQPVSNHANADLAYKETAQAATDNIEIDDDIPF